MAIYKLQVHEQLALRQRIATTSPGPFLVEAASEEAARLLVDLNFGGLCPRDHNGRRQSPLWLNRATTQCTRIDAETAGVARRNAIESRSEVANWVIETPVSVHNERPTAQMVWWPVDPDEPCPA